MRTNKDVYLGIRNISLIKADIHNPHPKKNCAEYLSFILSGFRLLWFFFFFFWVVNCFFSFFTSILLKDCQLPLSCNECGFLHLFYCFFWFSALVLGNLVISSLELSLIENKWLAVGNCRDLWMHPLLPPCWLFGLLLYSILIFFLFFHLLLCIFYSVCMILALFYNYLNV